MLEKLGTNPALTLKAYTITRNTTDKHSNSVLMEIVVALNQFMKVNSYDISFDCGIIIEILSNPYRMQ
jgi:hypothetical protein